MSMDMPAGRSVVRPEQRLTLDQTEGFRRQMLDAVARGEGCVTLDLRALDLLDSAGVAVVVQCHQTLKERGGRLTVLTDHDGIERVFKVLRLDEHFEVVRAA